jgi:hypothetical protein
MINAMKLSMILVILATLATSGMCQAETAPRRTIPNPANEYRGNWVMNGNDANCTDWYREPVQVIQKRAIRFQTASNCAKPYEGSNATQTLMQFYIDCPSGKQVLEFVKGFDNLGSQVVDRQNPYSGEDAFAGSLKDRSKAHDAMALLGFPIKHVPSYHMHLADKFCPK